MKKKGFFKFLCGVHEVHVGLSDNYSFSKIDISSFEPGTYIVIAKGIHNEKIGKFVKTK